MALRFLLLAFLLHLTALSQDPFAQKRLEMVRNQIADRGVSDTSVLRAMRSVPRHKFVPPSWIDEAYADHPVPIGYGQTISQPYIVAIMTELVRPRRDMKVLEVGTGSGYQAAVLSAIMDSVFSVEIVRELSAEATGRLRALGCRNVAVQHADGYDGWPEHAPYDAIVVTAAADYIPPPLIAQLRDGGRMIIPVGSPFMMQTLVLLEKRRGEVTTKSLLPVRFVPLVRRR